MILPFAAMFGCAPTDGGHAGGQGEQARPTDTASAETSETDTDPAAVPDLYEPVRRTPEDWATTTWGSCRALVSPRPLDDVDDIRDALGLYIWLSPKTTFEAVLDDASDGDCPRYRTWESGNDEYWGWGGPCQTDEGVSWSGRSERHRDRYYGGGGYSFDVMEAAGSTPSFADLSFLAHGSYADMSTNTTADYWMSAHFGLLRVGADLDYVAEPYLDGEYVFVHRDYSEETYVYVVDGAGTHRNGDFCVHDPYTIVADHVATIDWGSDGCGTAAIDGAPVGTLCWSDLGLD